MPQKLGVPVVVIHGWHLHIVLPTVVAVATLVRWMDFGALTVDSDVSNNGAISQLHLCGYRTGLFDNGSRNPFAISVLELRHQHTTVVIYYADRIDSSILLGLRQPSLQHLVLEDQSAFSGRDSIAAGLVFHLPWSAELSGNSTENGPTLFQYFLCLASSCLV